MQLEIAVHGRARVVDAEDRKLGLSLLILVQVRHRNVDRCKCVEGHTREQVQFWLGSFERRAGGAADVEEAVQPA